MMEGPMHIAVKISCIFLLAHLEAVAGARPLTHPILTLLDGVTFDGSVIGKISFVRRAIRKIQFGVMHPVTHTFHGKYLFAGRRSSVHELALYQKALERRFLRTISFLDVTYVDSAFASAWAQRQEELEQKQQEEMEEHLALIKSTIFDEEMMAEEQMAVTRTLHQKYEEKYNHQKEELKKTYIADYATYESRVKMARAEYEAQVQALQLCLQEAKLDLATLFIPVLKHLAGPKIFMYRLIQEFCQRRGKMGSFLLEWAHMQAGQEVAAFEKAISTFARLDELCTDIAQFLKDVIESCPKGWQQFLTLSQQT